MGLLLIQDTVTEKDSEWLSKNKEYLEYISNHCDNVIKAFNTYFKTTFTDEDSEELQIPVTVLNKARIKVKSIIETHDESKYSDEEFNAYRMKYFMTSKEMNKYDNDKGYKEIVDNNYEEAWKHHYLVNDHHPKHWKWVDIDETTGAIIARINEKSEATPMTLVAILHMFCDWGAMSIKFNNKLSDWYNTQADEEKRDMNPDTKIIVDRFVEWIKNHKE